MRLIDADEVEKILKHIREKYVNRLPKANQLFWDTIRYIEKKVRSIPPVEAVPVVHCKDCKHWGTGVAGETEHVKCCEYGKYMVGENGYCVYGEKV